MKLTHKTLKKTKQNHLAEPNCIKTYNNPNPKIVHKYSPNKNPDQIQTLWRQQKF